MGCDQILDYICFNWDLKLSFCGYNIVYLLLDYGGVNVINM